MNTEDFERLENKVDMLTKIMEEINRKLQQATIIAKEPIAPRPVTDKKKAFQDKVQKHLEMLRHRHQLQRQFNLMQPPHENRVLAYLRTQDPKVFDGLKRN
jgi:hypothetical protein